MADAAQETREVSREEARKLIDEGAQLVDVRAEHEWDAGRIAGAVHIPLDELARRTAEIDAERPVVLYCRGGTRSTMATDALADAGFDAAKLSEGIVGWS
ncbi:MAG TPA: rhodanese-like domain-containing protein, partial [Solirubrobacterales bacterium]|nr:rhodanese-like domain-containing protein [Solirubrobacterales bacterium]